MHQPFKTIAITGKPDDPGTVETVQQIASHLLSRGVAVRVDSAIVAAAATPVGSRSAPAPELIGDADMVISVGGDGTLLHTGRLVVEHDIPLLGVNRGRLGFLVDLPPYDLAGLDAILAGDFIEEDRILLRAEIRHDGQVLKQGLALNDVVLYKWNTARLVEFNTYIDGHLLTAHRADGIIIATPTGSTAYALASGGPIIHPSIDAIALVPVCPHTLSNRPLVIGADSVIEVEVPDDYIERVGVSCDGQADLGLQPGSRLVVRQHGHRVRLIHPPQYRYYDILRAKLRWGDTNTQ
jgi:NAD+ kinase